MVVNHIELKDENWILELLFSENVTIVERFEAFETRNTRMYDLGTHKLKNRCVHMTCNSKEGQ